MKFCYADPPYIGLAGYYPEKTEVDHAALIASLLVDFPDGWALSLHVPSLRPVLSLCPPDVRVGAWVKTWCSWKPGVNPAYAWEPVIFCGGRSLGRDVPTVRDWIACPVSRHKGLKGAKPAAFCHWLFAMLGAQPTDELVDMFPGTGAVTSAWQHFQARLPYAPPGWRRRADSSAALLSFAHLEDADEQPKGPSVHLSTHDLSTDPRHLDTGYPDGEAMSRRGRQREQAEGDGWRRSREQERRSRRQASGKRSQERGP